MSERKLSSMPLWGVAVTRIRCRPASAASLRQKLVPLLLRPAVCARRSGGTVRLVDDDQVRRMAQEMVALAVRLDEVDAGDEAAPPSVDREVASRQLTLEPCHGGRLHDVGLESELLGQLRLPLVTEMRRA